MQDKFPELVKNSSSSVAYMIREITHICRDLPSRAPGSEGEKRAGAYMADVLKRDCRVSDIKTEFFTEHPSAFYGYFYCTAALSSLGAFLFFVTPWLGLIFSVLSFTLFILQFILYREVIDPLFPKKKSINVTALRHCEGKCERRLFINGHIDAAWEFPLNYYLGGIAFETPGAMSVLGVIYYIVISICALSGASWAHTAALIGLIFIPFYILVGFTYNTKRVVDGANDNLSGCYLGIAVLKALEENDMKFEHTDIGVILTGSEEAGLKGAKAWSRAHKDDYTDVPTYILTLDTIHDPEFLMVNAKDLNGMLRSDQKMCEIFLKAADDMGVPCKKGWVPPFGGSTDSTGFTQGGFRSISVTGLDHKLERYYHTRKDSYDNMNPEGLDNCYRALLRFVQLADQGALDK